MLVEALRGNRTFLQATGTLVEFVVWAGPLQVVSVERLLAERTEGLGSGRGDSEN